MRMFTIPGQPRYRRAAFPLFFRLGLLFSCQPGAAPGRMKEQDGEGAAMDPTDETLMQAYRQGDETALARLVRRHSGPLLGYLTRMSSNPHQAEDLFQETFVRVHRHAENFRPDGRFKPWLYTIATRLAVDELRRRKRTPVLLSMDEQTEEHHSLADRLADPAAGPADCAAAADLRARVRGAVERLSPAQRAILSLTYFEGFTYPEAARALGRSLGTIKKQMSRALRTLARALPDLAPGHAAGGAA